MASDPFLSVPSPRLLLGKEPACGGPQIGRKVREKCVKVFIVWVFECRGKAQEDRLAVLAAPVPGIWNMVVEREQRHKLVERYCRHGVGQIQSGRNERDVWQCFQGQGRAKPYKKCVKFDGLSHGEHHLIVH